MGPDLDRRPPPRRRHGVPLTSRLSWAARPEPGEERIIEISHDAVYEVLDGEAVVLNLATGNYYRLNEVGTRAWELIDEHRDLARVRAAMLDEFDVAPAVLDADLDSLVGELAAMGLLITP